MSTFNFRTLQLANKRKTIFLLISLGFLSWLVAVAALSYFGGGGAAIVPLAVGFSLFSVWGSYYSSDKLVMRMTGARIIQESDNPKLFGLIQEVTIASGLPMPKVAIVEDEAPNAFATGRNPSNSSIAVTRGLISILNREELEGVLAHELSHIRNYDTLYATIVAVLAGAIVIAAYSMRWFAFGSRRSSSKRQLKVKFHLKCQQPTCNFLKM